MCNTNCFLLLNPINCFVGIQNKENQYLNNFRFHNPTKK
jgi:hypothetical protein